MGLFPRLPLAHAAAAEVSCGADRCSSSCTTSFATITLPAGLSSGNRLHTNASQHSLQPQDSSLLLPEHRLQRQEARRPADRLASPCFELAEAQPVRQLTPYRHRRPTPAELCIHNPLALVAIVPRPVVLFLAGAVAGALGKTLTAPLDRVKLLLQTSGGLQTGALQKAAKGGNLVQAFLAIGKAEGLAGYWKGNIPQILRVIPYSATQLYSYEVLKRRFKDKDGNLSVPARLAAGGCAGMMATLVTYPLDTLRLRLAVDPASRSIASASMAIIREGGKGAFFRGLGASLVGIAPYMALELAVFDLMPPDMPSFTRGFLAALLATTCCYPLDTVRRQIQLQSSGALKAGQVVHKIVERDGVGGLYRGFLPNALKNLPNKGAKLSTFHYAKRMLVASEQAYAKEVEIAEKAFQATASARAF